ncbi:ATP-dependent RNA helicase prh1, putative [Plasmodium berghei]|uniref:ATP-dependent RNA helicase DHX36, putative n=2 Tax=Plasmodium berghei TaxID=5821 RepID=A0A509AI29_PLABA|nr:ATP-dependent RNA helicase DHX36, putative [Plasmodium berghei ANKA]CXI24532.1 ATP-dependent RNA helicase prh1, putative [Plasmodium berghei]SCM20302.1 ATP-dependent RNA helicase prh1, putative [Plasmodium berghei]SCN23912.1 ATP-dependent RNA helicase prh1, putative [Plasmodium berghei]SCO59301.1 ATP-dependent RNA helicase prh1, putative [Plasmodium berghei]SCO60336.1 ATP-dependent RNA helicase prh1, putative [Plasmodium berghei]|eukprot:XP_034420840.1 ATP-dependent RNA helicase DHX36, putative [Plasmodium berghei ANKA]
MKDLPILRYKNEIKEKLKNNNLIVIKGETGCGKTTQVPQIINELYFDKKENDDKDEKSNQNYSKKILVSLPRRVATITVAERVSKEMKRGNVGEYVGYSIRFKNVCSKKTKIKFVTDGILIREIMGDPLLKNYKFIILDEIHERSIRTDVLLGYTKILLEKRKNLKIILMSATFDINIFNSFLGNPPIISIPHKIHKISIFYPKNVIEDYLLSIVCTILQIHFENSYTKKNMNSSEYYEHDDLKNADQELCDHANISKNINNFNTQTSDFANECDENYNNIIGDILVFLPGQEEIEMVNIMLKEKLKIIYKGILLKKLINDKKNTNINDDEDIITKFNYAMGSLHENPIDDISFHFGDIEIIPDKIYTMKILQLYSSLPNKKQKMIFDPVSPNTRKVILSTNIAETSVTIPNIKYVIDSGKAKVKFFDEKKGCSILKITKISKDSAIQRSGRAGREGPGKVYRIYTKEEYENMKSFLIPEIFRSDLTQIYLELKAMNIKNPLNFNFPENPKKEFFIHSAKMLFKIKAIDVNNNLTELGKQLSLLPISPIYGNMLLASVSFNCIDEMATLIALLNCDSIFLNFNFYDENDGVDTNLTTTASKNEDNDELKISDKNKIISISRKKLIHPDGDHLTIIHAFYLWEQEITNSEKKQFCNMYGLNNEVLINVQKIKKQLLEILSNKMGIKINKKLHMHKWDNIMMSLCKSCYFNVAKHISNSSLFMNLVTKTKLRIHPSSTLFNSFNKPSFIFYSDVVQTKKLYARVVTKVNPEWLIKYVPNNFQISKD